MVLRRRIYDPALPSLSLSTLQKGVNDVFSDFLTGWPTDVFGRWSQREDGAFTPKINVTEDEKEIVVTAELPGLKKEDVKVGIEDGLLTISGEKKSKVERKEGQATYSEIEYGSFCRRLTLNAEVNEDNIAASFDNGELVIRLPRSDKAKASAKSITIR